MSTWIGVQSVAYVPTVITNDPRWNQPPANFKDVVTQRLLFDPVNGVDRSLRTYLFQVSYGRAILEPTVVDAVSLALTGNGLGDTSGAAITAALANTPFQNAAVVYPGAGTDWAFWGGPPSPQTNVTGFCYDFLSSGVGAWAMELTHILTSFGDLYQTSDGNPWGFDNMACACGVHPSTFTKLKLGWLDPGEILEVRTGSATATLHALGLPRPSPPGRVTAIKIPTTDPQHYFLIEARLKTDTFEAGLPSEGVVVYEIQEAVWAPVHLRTPTALGVSQSFNGFAQVTVNAAVPGGCTVQVVAPAVAIAVPDLTDETLAEARQDVTNAGLRLQASGTGVVVAQRPMAGTLVPLGSIVHVTLSRLAPENGNGRGHGAGGPAF